jgi:guanine deaminase
MYRRGPVRLWASETETTVPYADERPSDAAFLTQAIDISRQSLTDAGKTPFGAVVVIRDDVIATGVSSVVELVDPTAHAEVMALRAAGSILGRYLMPEAVMYSSSEPCPMCLAACYWAHIPRLVYAATSRDVDGIGLSDLAFARQLALPKSERTLLQEVPVDGALRRSAAAVLTGWAERSQSSSRPPS